jgi:hypothetical protein
MVVKAGRIDSREEGTVWKGSKQCSLALSFC